MTRTKTFRISISDLVKAISGHEVRPINLNDTIHKQIVSHLKNALNTIVSQDNVFHARRPNDISDNTQGECFEDRLVKYFNLNAVNMIAHRLTEKGYPNIEIRDNNGNVLAYVEVKVTSTARVSKSSARDFYISPGSIRNYKVTTLDQTITYTFEISPGKTASKIQDSVPHLLILGIVKNIGASSEYQGYNDWELIDYKIYDLFGLHLKTKIEFNANYNDIETECKEL